MKIKYTLTRADRFNIYLHQTYSSGLMVPLTSFVIGPGLLIYGIYIQDTLLFDEWKDRYLGIILIISGLYLTLGPLINYRRRYNQFKPMDVILEVGTDMLHITDGTLANIMRLDKMSELTETKKYVIIKLRRSKTYVPIDKLTPEELKEFLKYLHEIMDANKARRR
ncbi:MAG: hypothetical protein NTX03_14935 [Bacteroidetes bacterium]|nr:hypothetical protein [Bacteroidota bacterium]